MCATERKTVLDLPLKVILTEEGASHFISKKRKLLRFKLADNLEEYGVQFKNFAPISLQLMILVDYVSKIEISMPEFVSSRQEIMDLSKVVVFSILYKQFDRQILTAILETDCIRRHNRQNPSQLLDQKTQLPDREVRSYLFDKDEAIDAARKVILEPIWHNIVSNNDLTPEEKNIQLLMAEKFLNRLSLFNWYIIMKFYKAEGFPEILSAIRSTLNEYMEKSLKAFQTPFFAPNIVNIKKTMK